MKNPLSPVDVVVLMQCYYMGCPSSVSPAITDSLNDWKFAGCIKKDGKDYKVTQKGEAVVKKICSVGQPRCIWSFEE